MKRGIRYVFHCTALGYCRREGTPRRIANVEMNKYVKLMDAIFAYIDEMRKKGGPFKQGKDMRKEYQKLIDGVDYDAIQFFDIH